MAAPKKTRVTKNDTVEKKAQTKKTNNKRSTAATQSKESTLAKPEQINIEKLIAEALLRYKTKNSFDAQKSKEMHHLAYMCEEYLSTFALIGYSLENESVVVFNMPTPKDEAALVDLLRSTFINVISNRP